MKYSVLMVLIIALFLGGCTWPGEPDQKVSGNGAPVNGTTTVGNTPQTQGAALDLSGQGLAKIPEYVFERTELEKLDVSGNRLEGAIQAEIRLLQSLKALDASGNLMTGVPAEIGQLEKLETLDLSDNRLTGLPHELGNLKNLKTLNLSGNDYSELDLGVITQNLPQNVDIIR